MIQVILLVIQFLVLIVSYRNFHKAEKVRDEAQALLDHIEESDKKQQEWDRQTVNNLMQQTYNSAYNEGYNQGFVKGRSLNRKRKKK